MKSIGLVLGAGGVTGGAYHAGVIGALADTTGWDARTATVIVGTSAGSLLASSLRAGLGPADSYRRSTGDELSPEGKALIDQITTPWVMGVPEPESRRPAAPWLIARGLLRQGPIRPIVSLVGTLPRGTVNNDAMAARMQQMMGDKRWPDEPTWICAARYSDGKRVVFGRDDIDVPNLGVALQASCAVPGLFEPVTVAGSEFVDGGIVSATNAELVAALGLDLVVISSPMSAAEARLSASGLSRTWHHRTLHREIDLIRKGGTEVFVVEPDETVLSAQGADNMDADRNPDVAQASWALTRRTMSRADANVAVELLRAA